MKAKWVLAGVFIGLALGVWAGININVRVLDKNQQKELAEYQAIDNDVLKAIHDPALTRLKIYAQTTTEAGSSITQAFIGAGAIPSSQKEADISITESEKSWLTQASNIQIKQKECVIASFDSDHTAQGQELLGSMKKNRTLQLLHPDLVKSDLPVPVPH